MFLLISRNNTEILSLSTQKYTIVYSSFYEDCIFTWHICVRALEDEERTLVPEVEFDNTCSIIGCGMFVSQRSNQQ